MAQQYKVEMVDIERLSAAPFNPPDRTEARNLSDLKASIEELGILQPIVATRDYMIADGHRRWTCARELGLKQVPVHFRDMPIGAVWSANKGVRGVKPSTWLSAVEGGLPLENVAPSQRQIIGELRRVLSNEEFHSLAERQRSPGIFTQARQIAVYLNESGDEFMRLVILWLHKHRMSYIARRLREDSIPVDILREAIVQDRPLARFWTLA